MNRRTLLCAAPAALASVALTAPDPDADIYALIEQHRTNWCTVNNHSGPEDASYEALMATYYQSREAVIDCEPATLRGLLSKARVMRFEGSDDPIAHSIIEDLLRLGETA